MGIRIGDVVKIRESSPAMQTWGYAGRMGRVVDGDPRGLNPDVFQVELDDWTIPFGGLTGIHRDFLELVA